MSNNFDVLPYSNENLLKIFKHFSKLSEQDIKKKLHFIYFKDYLKALECKTIIIESEYVDKDYLDDYSEYFVKCFKSYNRFCSRIHFFLQEIKKSDYEASLLNEDNKIINNENYLGFIILKPLPNTFIGRTCLKTYTNKDSRFYGVIRDYIISLHGKKLKIKSLAYQEQDGIVSACATSALWSVFHATGKLFQHNIPTPIKITKNAITNMPIRDRGIPSSGLTPEEMIKAINSVTLEAEYLNISNNPGLFKEVIYAYTKFGIPLIFGIDLFNKKNNKFLGKHAVTVCGFNLDSNNNIDDDFKIKLKSKDINKIYIHDDQVGPFAKCEIDNKNIVINYNGNSLNYSYSLCTSWLDEDNNYEMGNIIMLPILLIVPVYNKIRIRLDDIILELYKHINHIAVTMNLKLDDVLEQIIWDIRLYEVGKFKEEIIKTDNIDKKKKIEFLTKNHPKYLWVAKAYINENLYRIYIFDATDIKTNDLLIDIL